YIEINEISPGDLHIQIVNAVGEVVYQRSALATENYYLQELHLGTLPAGIYNLTINSEDSESSVSFLIQ
ncbi:MAG: T9SS type A sorting domain-containing protein, partial [Chitinophagales bacterium]|nr:T9SS type A sorting domain-containing protein [Chitinophagales bacterium]